MDSIQIKSTDHPHFIGAWRLDDLGICDDIVGLFEANQEKLQEGGIGLGGINKRIKNSTDLVIEPKDLEREDHVPLMTFMNSLHQCYLSYIEEWDFIASFTPRIHIGRFNIQRYEIGGHFNQLHSERTTLNTLHRLLVWMAYLNDVDEGGETEFPHYGLKIAPEKGKVIIWPAEWTHAHRGCPVIKGSKYIITGWMHYAVDS
ncbi:MAG: 2OG-Fe(II) oxygenase [Rhodospirillaceae bacterium]|nr:2OG-Fe(II) oxygenase [Rhodospirillaceae bacterium]HAA93733.1 2OG-Fe(II) oxygenase [Rhodospirillaceae bacterium]